MKSFYAPAVVVISTLVIFTNTPRLPGDSTNNLEATILYNRGVCFSNSMLFDKAIACYDAAIMNKPRFAQAYFMRGRAFAQKGYSEKGIEDYSMAIDIKPDYTEALYYRGKAYFNKALYETAMSDFERVIELDDNFIGIYSARGQCYIRLGLFEEAVEDLERVIKLNPRDKMAYYNLACSYSLQEKKEMGLASLKKSVQLGFNNLHMIESDPGLESIRETDGYRDIISSLKKYSNNHPSSELGRR